MSRFHSNRFFALQVSTHDSTFAPRPKPTGWRRAIVYVALVPAIALIATPSFRLGRMIQTAPSFAVPDKVTEGSVFTLPADTGLLAVQLAGRPLPMIEKPRPLFLGSANDVSELELDVTYKGPERRLDPKALLPRFEHPVVPVYSKKILVEQLPVSVPIRKTASTAKSDAEPAAPEATDNKLFERVDGKAQAACWKRPELKMVESMTAQVRRNRRVNPWRMATLSAAAGGEVVHAGPTAKSERTVVLSHGGGLFSRYDDLKEVRVRKGDKIRGGQILGVLNAGSTREPASINWGVQLGSSEVSPESFLALSSQLCDSK